MKVAGNRLWTEVVLCALISVLVVGTAQAGLFGLWGSKKKKTAVVQKQSLVIFPFDQDGVRTAPKGFGTFVASDIRAMLADSERYSPVLFRSQLPPIQRASQDGTLKADDAPYELDNSGNLENTAFSDSDSKQKTLKLAQLLCTEFYLVGAVDEVNVQAAQKRADITLRAELYNGKTGKLVKTFLITGQSPESLASGDEDELRDVAKGAAVTKLMAELTASTEAPAVTAVPAAPSPATPPAPAVVSEPVPANKGAQPVAEPTQPSKPVIRPPDKPSK